MIRHLVIVCGLAGTALAQPSAEAQEPVPATDPQPPPPPPTPPQPPQPPVVHEIIPTKAEAEPDRPTGFSIGIGVGYRFPTSLSIPNDVSVRFRLPNGITFEPSLVLASSSQVNDVGTETSQTATELGVGALARFSLVGHRKTELELLATFAVDSLTQDPSDQNPDDQRSTTTTTFGYGIAVGWWITPHLQVSLSATNSLVTYTHLREEMGFDFVSVNNTTTFGLIFDPTVVAMIHLYN